MIRWSPGGESQRDQISLELPAKRRLEFEKALSETLENIERFPEIGRVSTITRGREDIREVLFGGGYRLAYGLFDPEFITVISIIPPGSSQALD